MSAADGPTPGHAQDPTPVLEAKVPRAGRTQARAIRSL